MSREQIAEVLKQYRISRGLSVQQVCDWLASKGHNVKQKTLYSYESGHRQPDADVLMRLCELYEVENILEAFGYGANDFTLGKEAVNRITGKQKRLLDVCDLLDDEGLSKVIEYAEDLASSGKYKKGAENQAI